MFVAADDQPNPRRIRLRYPTKCADCGIALSRGTEAFWDSDLKRAVCLACTPNGIGPLQDVAGASAAAEGERRTQRRIEDARRRYGDHAAAVAREMAARDAAATWGKGSEGESRLASFITRELGDTVIGLHDRLIPGTRGNVDHIFIAPTGVWVVDAKAYKGRVEKREVGPIWRRENEVYVGGRNRSGLTRGVETQVAAVTAALRGDPELQGTQVHGALCFLGEWALLDFPFQVGNIWVLYAGALRKRLRKRGPIHPETMEQLARRIALGLPPAQ